MSSFKSSSFAPAFFFLNPERRRALKTLYAFCRVIDDTVDEGEPTEARRTLEAWRQFLQGGKTPPRPELAGELSRLQRLYSVQARHLLDLIKGVEMDLSVSRYQTFDDLKPYLYGVASTVGLACLSIFGLEEPANAFFAVNLGYAVQLTNILRDVKKDAARGRLYLPLEDLKRFQVAEADILEFNYTDNFASLMKFEADRARDLYEAALANLPLQSRRAARPALVMAGVYRALLEELERFDFNVFESPDLRPSAFQKMRGVIAAMRSGR